ncbi:MAG TPA: hypothetical protein PLE74_01230 [Candidatus Cloacimonadota bacterium]|nr:hypothetical protein [Candidatus Cloacimonadota bacterium]
MTPYITVVDAQAYFSERLHTDAWDDASDTDKLKALIMATRAIDKLNFIGDKADPDQELQFPRGDDENVPTAIKEATCELALRLLDDVDADMEIENTRINSNGISSIQNTYDARVVQDYVLAGIPSPTAWHLLAPYLRDSRELNITRAT